MSIIFYDFDFPFFIFSQTPPRWFGLRGDIISLNNDMAGGRHNVHSLINGIVYLFVSWFGLLALIRSGVNKATVGPIVLVVSLMIFEECLRSLPSRHYVAMVFGLFPSICGEILSSSTTVLGFPFSIASRPVFIWPRQLLEYVRFNEYRRKYHSRTSYMKILNGHFLESIHRAIVRKMKYYNRMAHGQKMGLKLHL